MIHEDYRPYMSDPHFKAVYADWQDALWTAGEDLDDPEVVLDRARANLTFSAWFGRYKADLDPHFGKPITVEMQADVSERCAPIMKEFERTHEMLVLLPNWENRTGDPNACYLDKYTGKPKRCLYCSGIITNKSNKPQYITRQRDEHAESEDE